jgi:hypothetical protein
VRIQLRRSVVLVVLLHPEVAYSPRYRAIPCGLFGARRGNRRDAVKPQDV